MTVERGRRRQPLGRRCRAPARPRASSSSARTSTRCRPAAGSTACSASWPRSACCARSRRPTRRRRSRCASSTGPTRRARASAAACSAPPPSRARSTPTTSATCATPRAPACRTRSPPAASTSTRAGGATERLRRRARLPRAAHRAGPGAARHGRLASAVAGTVGDERHLVTFTGQAAHAGSTPMRLRRDSLAAAATAALEIREVGIRHDGVCTVGSMKAEPGVITAVAGSTEMMLDLRHLDADVLATMLAECLGACDAPRRAFDCTVESRRIFGATPTPFHPELVAVARDGGRRGGRRRRRPDPERAAARRDGDRAARARPSCSSRSPTRRSRTWRSRTRPRRRCASRSTPTGARSGQALELVAAGQAQRGRALHGLRRRPADRPARRAGHRPRQAGRDVRLLARVDVRLAPAVGGAVRHLQPDPQRDAQARRRARWSRTRRRATGRSRRRCSRR